MERLRFGNRLHEYLKLRPARTRLLKYLWGDSQEKRLIPEKTAKFGPSKDCPLKIQQLENLYEISKVLTRFEDVKQSLPEFLAVAAKEFSMQSAVLIVMKNGFPDIHMWTSPGASRQVCERAKSWSLASLSCLIDWPPLQAAGININHFEIAAFSQLTESECEFDKEASPNRFVVLPLVVGRGPIFGVLQLEGVESIDEYDVEFVNSITNQLAIAIDRLNAITRQRELLVGKEAAEEASKLKNAFLANMSHEIRTPLVALIGFAELLKDMELDQVEHDKYVDIIFRSGRDLMAIIDDILDLAKIEAGRLELEWHPLSLSSLLAEVVQLLGIKAQSKDITINVDVSDPQTHIIISDIARLRQILINIIGNAIKFTDHGEIKITVSRQCALSQESSQKIAIMISDTGIGIPEMHQARIFDPFYQADNSIARKYGGTGLGLALSKNFANLLGGDITLTESVPGKGSSFVIEIDPGHRKLAAYQFARKASQSREKQ